MTGTRRAAHARATVTDLATRLPRRAESRNGAPLGWAKACATTNDGCRRGSLTTPERGATG